MIIKVKNYRSLFYCEQTNMICLDDNIIVNASRVILDDPLMQSYVMAKKTFTVIYSKTLGNTVCFDSKIPNIKNFITNNINTKDNELMLTDLISVKTKQNNQKTDFRVLFRKQDTGFTYVDNTYIKLLTELTQNLPDVVYCQENNLSQINVYADNVFMALIMPVKISECQLSDMYSDRIEHDVKKRYIEFVD